MGVPSGGPYTLEQRKEGIKRGALYEYSKNVGIYHCPKDKTGNFRSYSIPGCLSGMEEEKNPMNPRWKVLVRLSQVKRPAEKYVFLEETETRGFNMESWEKDPDGIRWADLLTVWHNKSSNISFADGHSGNVKWSKDTVDHFVNHPNDAFRPSTPEAIKDLKYMLAGWAE
jgi:prepilin-type processing-associated H-X9-DG protein